MYERDEDDRAHPAGATEAEWVVVGTLRSSHEASVELRCPMSQCLFPPGFLHHHPTPHKLKGSERGELA